jgi:hypothetical protein
VAEDIRIKTERFSHPLVQMLLNIGVKNDPHLSRSKKLFVKTYQTKLRWMGAFLATTKIYPRLDKVADAVFISVYKDMGFETQFNEAKIALDVQDDLLSVVESVFKLLSPIL